MIMRKSAENIRGYLNRLFKFIKEMKNRKKNADAEEYYEKDSIELYSFK